MPKETVLPSGIQLLPEEQLHEESLSQFLKWALTFGRYIVIFTEGIVLFVFLSRFWLDSQIIDLKQVITGKAQIVQSAQNFEKEFLQVQAKMKMLQGLQKEVFSTSPYFAIVEETIPQQAILTNLTINPDGVTVQGKTSSYDVVTAFEQGLKNRDEFVEVKLSSLSREQLEQGGEGAVIFTIKATFVETEVVEESKEPPVGGVK